MTFIEPGDTTGIPEAILNAQDRRASALATWVSAHSGLSVLVRIKWHLLDGVPISKLFLALHDPVAPKQVPHRTLYRKSYFYPDADGGRENETEETGDMFWRPQEVTKAHSALVSGATRLNLHLYEGLVVNVFTSSGAHDGSFSGHEMLQILTGSGLDALRQP